MLKLLGTCPLHQGSNYWKSSAGDGLILFRRQKRQVRDVEGVKGVGNVEGVLPTQLIRRSGGAS